MHLSLWWSGKSAIIWQLQWLVVPKSAFPDSKSLFCLQAKVASVVVSTTACHAGAPELYLRFRFQCWVNIGPPPTLGQCLGFARDLFCHAKWETVTVYFSSNKLTPFSYALWSQQTRAVEPMWIQCWATVCDAVPTLSSHWFNVTCLLGYNSIL